MTDDEHEDEPQAYSFQVGPGGLADVFNSMREEHQKEHMAAEDRQMQVDNFMAGLSPEQLVILRYILNLEPPNETNQYFDGQAHALLKFVHHVDPMTGRDEFAQLAEEPDPAAE
jgi:hypothetical protein